MADNSFTIYAVAAAVGSAALSIVGKVIYDIASEARRRRSIASALAGEIGAYYRTINPPQLVAGLRTHALENRAGRQDWLRSFPPLPAGHPVFDKVADQVGMLSPEIAQRVSEAYNVVSGMRTLMMGLSLQAFVDASDALHTVRLTAMADALEKAFLRFPELVAMLKVASEPWYVRAWRRVSLAESAFRTQAVK